MELVTSILLIYCLFVGALYCTFELLDRFKFARELKKHSKKQVQNTTINSNKEEKDEEKGDNK